MNVPVDPLTATSGLPLHPTLREAVRAPRRRRPTGEPPPLPYHLQTSGVGWLIAAGVLIALSVVVFREGLRGPAIAVTVVDDAVVGWLAGSQLPGYVGIMGGWRRSARGGCSTGWRWACCWPCWCCAACGT